MFRFRRNGSGSTTPADPGHSPEAGNKASSPGTSICTWGDSLTFGLGASSWDAVYPTRLATLLGRAVINNGVPAQCSRSIAARQGSVPAQLTFSDNMIQPGVANLVTVSAPPVTQWSWAGGLSGSVQGIPGTLMGTDTTNATLGFTPIRLAAPIKVPRKAAFIPDTDAQRDDINVLWIGRNNFHDADRVVADVAASIQYVRSRRVIVLSVINGEDEGKIRMLRYKQIIALNQRLATLPGATFLDVRARLIAAYDHFSPKDVLCHSLDIPPPSLRVNGDGLHLNDAGYEIVARAVAQVIQQKGW
jgi:lysophospholipase L1-like esterase